MAHFEKQRFESLFINTHTLIYLLFKKFLNEYRVFLRFPSFVYLKTAGQNCNFFFSVSGLANSLICTDLTSFSRGI